jgi:diguanylate cyclase (GGDEF)-like protein
MALQRRAAEGTRSSPPSLATENGHARGGPRRSVGEILVAADIPRDEPRESTLVSELERSKRALLLAQERISELTQTQLVMSGTLGQFVELASTDPLTGLSNRRRFTETLKQSFEAARSPRRPLSLVMLDIDQFKSYNDSFGHAAGDRVIWIVAKLLLRNSGGDQVVARYGGEEFAILLPGVDHAQSVAIAERQRTAIESYPWPARRVTASAGVSSLTLTTTDACAMLEEADRALYHSKSQGRNCVTHHRHWQESARRPESSLEPIPSSDQPSPASTTSSDRKIPAQAETDADDTRLRPNPQSGTRLLPRETAAGPAVTDQAWDALERYIQALQAASHGSDPYQHVLSAIREGTESEIAFLCNDQTGELLGTVGDHVPFSQWYQQLARMISQELPSGGIWTPSDRSPRATPAVEPEPSSIVALPVKSPRACWLVALRFRQNHRFGPEELRVARVIWQLHMNHHRNDRVHDKLKETLFGVVRCLSAAIDAKDPYTCGHSERVARIAVRIGQEMGLSGGEASDLYLAGLLHDLGKIGIRDAVLCKEGPLTPEEYLHIQEHPVTGERIIANVTSLAYLRPGIRGHHERYDGKGYPDGLVGESIPRMARILAVADACDAMMSARRYRPALSEARIEQIFREGAGTQWDPHVVKHFLECRHELYAVIQRGLGQSVYFAVERAVGAGETMTGGKPGVSPKSLSSLAPNRSPHVEITGKPNEEYSNPTQPHPTHPKLASGPKAL